MKKKICILTCIALTACNYSIAQQSSVPAQEIDVEHIRLELTFDLAKKQARGSTMLTLSLLTRTDHIYLDAGMLGIETISIDSGVTLSFEYDDGDKKDGLKILLDRKYDAGEKISIRIKYHTNYVNETDPNNLWGSNGKGLRFFEPTSTEPLRKKQAWSCGEPESNRYWYPCKESPGDLLTSEIFATIETPLVVISNGEMISSSENKNNTRTFHWKDDHPHANHQVAIVAGEYVAISENAAGVQLNSFGYPDEAKAVEESVIQLREMMTFYSKITDVPYPAESYSQVFVQELPGWMGSSTMSITTENMIDDERTHKDFFYLWDITEAEALAHQWFGNYVHIHDWSDIWLDKGFSRYFNQLYDEHKNGKEEFLLYQHLWDHNTVYLNDWNFGVREPVVNTLIENPADLMQSNYPAVRGALVLHLLRKHLGEYFWQKSAYNYLTTYANKTVTTEDFRRCIEEVTNDPMTWFFDQWIYGMGHPVFEVRKEYDAANKELLLSLDQVQQHDSTSSYKQVDYFQGKMEIEIDGKIESIWVLAQKENQFTFPVSAEPKLVHVDFESTWIKEIHYEKTLNELIYQLQNDKDILGRQWALSELVTLAKKEKTSVEEKDKIYESFREAMASDVYWRFRYNVLLQLQGLQAPAWDNSATLKDGETIALLGEMIKEEESWMKTASISFLGMTREAKYADLYIECLEDSSDRVINAAAIALGKSKSPKAFDAFQKLKNKPSWKNQSLISSLYGLKELKDERGFKIAFDALSDLESPRWTLATPVWDYRIAAAETIVALGKSEKAYPLILELFNKAMMENDINSIFNQVLIITTLADPRGKEIFESLKKKFIEDTNILAAIAQFEEQFTEKIKNKK